MAVGEQDTRGLSRRDIIKRAGVGGALVWTIPVIDSVSAAAGAQAGTPGGFCGHAISFVAFLYQCVGDPNVYGVKIEANGDNTDLEICDLDTDDDCQKIGGNFCERQLLQPTPPPNFQNGPKPGHDFLDADQTNGHAVYTAVGTCPGDAGDVTTLEVKLSSGCTFVAARVFGGGECVDPTAGEDGYTTGVAGLNDFTFHSTPK